MNPATRDRAGGSPVLRGLMLVGQLGKGGTERQLFLVARELRRSGDDISVVVFNPSPNRTYSGELIEAGITVFEIPPTCRGVRRRAAWLFRLIRRHRPDVVHSWSVHDNVYAGVVGAMAGVPVRWGSLRGSLSLNGFQGLPRLYKRAALRVVRRLVVNSQYLADELRAAGVDSSRVVLLPNCVEPLRQVGSGLTGFPTVGEGPLVAVVGNLRRVKNHMLFVRVMARVIDQVPSARGLIVGQEIPSSPGIRAEIEEEIVRLGLPGKVTLAGFLDDVQRLMPRLSVLCITSDSEGSSNVALEAMAAGLPVVATGVGGVPEVVRSGRSGYIVPRRDEAALAERVVALLKDESLRKVMGETGLRLAEEEHSPAAAARRLRLAYLGDLPAARAQELRAEKGEARID